MTDVAAADGVAEAAAGRAVTAPAGRAVDPAQLTLAEAPAPDAGVLAAITAAVQLAWPRPAPPDESDPVHESWRFSGRWWHKPVPARRDRPWAGR